jgi:hypothetical protein
MADTLNQSKIDLSRVMGPDTMGREDDDRPILDANDPVLPPADFALAEAFDTASPAASITSPGEFAEPGSLEPGSSELQHDLESAEGFLAAMGETQIAMPAIVSSMSAEERARYLNAQIWEHVGYAEKYAVRDDLDVKTKEAIAGTAVKYREELADPVNQNLEWLERKNAEISNLHLNWRSMIAEAAEATEAAAQADIAAKIAAAGPSNDVDIARRLSEVPSGEHADIATARSGLSPMSMVNHPTKVAVEEFLDAARTKKVAAASKSLAAVDLVKNFTREATKNVDGSPAAAESPLSEVPPSDAKKDGEDPQKDNEANRQRAGGVGFSLPSLPNMSGLAKIVTAPVALTKNGASSLYGSVTSFVSSDAREARSVRTLARRAATLERDIAALSSTPFAVKAEQFARIAAERSLTPADLAAKIRNHEVTGVEIPTPSNADVKQMRKIRHGIDGVALASEDRIRRMAKRGADEVEIDEEGEKLKNLFGSLAKNAGDLPINGKFDRVKDYAIDNFSRMIQAIQKLIERIFGVSKSGASASAASPGM